MTTCPCGCADPVKPGNTYAHGWCTGRRFFKKRTLAQQRRTVQIRESRMTPEQKRQRMQILHGAERARRWELLMDRWLKIWEQDGDPRAALREAYKLGYGAGRNRDLRQRQREKQAAAGWCGAEVLQGGKR